MVFEQSCNLMKDFYSISVNTLISKKKIKLVIFHTASEKMFNRKE